MKFRSFVFLLMLTSAGFTFQVNALDDPRGLKVVYGEKRIALVIGNAKYKSSPLTNPVNDANDFAKLLLNRKFQVTLLTDASKEEIVGAIRKFSKDINGGGVGLFYYAGHGMQVNGRNYLIPVDADIKTEDEVEFEAVDAGRVLEKMDDANNRLNIVILDACRDNPFARSFRSTTKGLARMDAPSGTLIAYATSPGMAAADGKDGNGVYTGALLSYMQEPGMEISSMFKRVRKTVQDKTGEQQTPWESTSLTGDFYFTPIDENAMAVAVVPAVPARTESVVQVASPKPAPMPDPIKVQPVDSGSRSGGDSVSRNAGDTRTVSLGDGVEIEFVWIPAGEFTMGTVSSEGSWMHRPEEGPQHNVNIARGFWIGKYEVTQRQYKHIMDDNPSYFNKSGLDAPVDKVSWLDAKKFCKVASLKTAEKIRLPSEAEWEYACRAGTKDQFFSSEDQTAFWEYAWYSSNSGKKTHSVGEKKPNAWGIYDLHGNIKEWCEDSWHDDYSNAPADGSPWIDEKDASKRVLRGGCWVYDARLCHSAYRSWYDSKMGSNSSGFRIVVE